MKKCSQCFQCFHSKNIAQQFYVVRMPENTFIFENIDNIGKVKSGIINYFRGPKIIFEKKTIFGLTSQCPGALERVTLRT